MTIFTATKTKGSQVAARAKYFEGEQKDQAGYDDYYLNAGSDTQSARFIGGALGVAGIKEGQEPKPGDYEKLFNGYRIDNGADFLDESKRKDLSNNNRVHGFSTAFSLDKSISLFYAASDKEVQAKILEAMHDAAEDTINFGEDHGKFVTRRGKAGGGGREAVKVMAASYAHITSRSVDGLPPDPQLHVHLEIANYVLAEDGSILSLDAYNSLFKRQGELRALYDVAFYRRLEEAGVDLKTFQNDFLGYGLETVAVSEEQVLAHSKRRQQLIDALGGKLHASAEEKAKANLLSRESKDYDIDYDELHEGWKESIGEIDLNAEGSRKPPTLLEVEHVLFKGRSVTTMDHLERTAAQLAIGDPRGLEAVEEKQKEIIRELGIMYCRDEDKITTKDFVLMEGELLRYAIRQRYNKIHDLDNELVKAAIERFQSSKRQELRSKGVDSQFILNKEQERAVYHLSKTGFAIMQGAAGTGKSATLGAVQEVYKSAGYTVTGVAPSGKAADGLDHDGIDNAQTIHKLLIQIEKGEKKLSDKDLIIFDEAGMADTRTLHAISYYAEKAGAKLIKTGDGQQLEAVGSASSFSMLSDDNAAGATELIEIARQKTEIDRTIAKAWLSGGPGEAWQMAKKREYEDGRTQVLACGVLDDPDPDDAEEVKDHAASVDALATMTRDTEATALEKAAQGYLADLRKDEASGGIGESVLLLADTRGDVRALNESVRNARIEAGEVNDDEGLDFRFDLGRGKFRDERLAPGDRVMFRRSDKEMGVVNGTTGKVISRTEVTDKEGNKKKALNVQLDDGSITSVSTDYMGLELSYATTVHKSQGMTVNISHYLAADIASRRAAYVASTRARFMHTTYLDANNAGKIEKNVKEFKSKETAITAVQAGFEQVAIQEYELLYESLLESGASEHELKEIQARIDSLRESAIAREKAALVPDSLAWVVQDGGFSQLSETDQDKARDAHTEWQSRNPERHTFDLYQYVSYVQEKHKNENNLRVEKPAPERKPDEVEMPPVDIKSNAISAPKHGIITLIELSGERIGEGITEEEFMEEVEEKRENQKLKEKSINETETPDEKPSTQTPFISDLKKKKKDSDKNAWSVEKKEQRQRDESAVIQSSGPELG